MAKIPDAFIEDMKVNTSLVKFASKHTKLKRVGKGVWQGECPHPKHKDSTPSFTVWEKHNSWCCYGCHAGKKGGFDDNKGSDIYAFCMWLFSINFRQSVEMVAKFNDVAIPTDANQKLYDKNKRLSDKYVKDLNESEPHVLEYLYERGFDCQDLIKWQIGFDKFSKRIVFPLFDRYNNVVGFNKRVVEKKYNGGDKYVNSAASPIFNKSTYFYGIHDLDPDCKEIRITEGSIDVVLANKYKAKNVVASLGTSFTESHAAAIYKLGLTPVLIFDGDTAGENGLNKAITYFESLGVYCKIVKLPKGKDLADMASDLKYGLEAYIQKKSMTVGFYKAKKTIEEYQSSLYELRLETLPKLDNILDIVPLTEKRAIKSFIKDEMNITID